MLSDDFFFVTLPYVAVVLFVGVSIMRYRKEPFTFSSLSSQFLESRKLFWGSVPFHIGILLLFFGHVVGFFVPRAYLAWNGEPVRLLIFETTGIAAALLTFFGLVALILRRFTSDRIVQNTTVADLVVYALLFFQIVTGLWVALALQWGGMWYPSIVVPYLRSLVMFSPEIAGVAALPLIAKLHIVGAFALFGAFSFTRLVHVLVAPVPYLWRPVQLVIWNRDRREKANPTGVAADTSNPPKPVS